MWSKLINLNYCNGFVKRTCCREGAGMARSSRITVNDKTYLDASIITNLKIFLQFRMEILLYYIII